MTAADKKAGWDNNQLKIWRERHGMLVLRQTLELAELEHEKQLLESLQPIARLMQHEPIRQSTWAACEAILDAQLPHLS